MKNKYIVAIDYRANYKPLTIDYKMLKAENLLDAMNEAEQYILRPRRCHLVPRRRGGLIYGTWQCLCDRLV